MAQQVESGEKLRVSTADGRIIELSHDVELAADSLVGFTDDPGDDASSPRIAIAYDDIETIEARRSNTDATIGVGPGRPGRRLIAAAS